MIRLFAAISVPGDIGLTLGSHQTGLRDARWRPAEALHVTLRFFGAVNERRAEDIAAALEVAAIEAFDLTLAGAGAFGEGQRLNSIWAGVADSEPLARLAARCETAARRAGCAPETRKFSPHVTLAYLRRPEPLAVADWLSEHGALKSAPFHVARFGLYSSWPGETATRYELERYYPLR